MTARRVQVLMFIDGERYPILLGAAGSPEWYPTLFITTQARNAGQSYNTAKAKLSAIRMLLSWADSRGLSLVERFASRHWLKTHEIESLYEYIQRRFRSELGSGAKLSAHGKRTATSVASALRVNSDSHYVRLTNVAKYLSWLATAVREQYGNMSEADRTEISSMRALIEAHRPVKRSESRIFARMGLDAKQLNLLLDILRPNSEHNPFREDVRGRNELILWLLIALGPRCSETLKIKTTDINFQSNEILIGLRRDDPLDPRFNEPVPKTLDRRLVLDERLIQKTHDYVLYERKKLPQAKRHAFLFVVHQAGPFQGRPLSQRGLNKIFESIRHAQPKILGNIHPHALRHTSNDLLSEWCDANDIPEAREEQIRSYKYGWEFGSGTAAHYNKRRIERETREASLRHQASLLSKKPVVPRNRETDAKE